MKHGHLHHFADWIPPLLPCLDGLIGDIQMVGKFGLRQAKDLPRMFEFVWGHVTSSLDHVALPHSCHQNAFFQRMEDKLKSPSCPHSKAVF